MFNIPSDISAVLRMSKERKHKLRSSNNFLNEMFVSKDSKNSKDSSDQVVFNQDNSDKKYVKINVIEDAYLKPNEEAVCVNINKFGENVIKNINDQNKQSKELESK